MSNTSSVVSDISSHAFTAVGKCGDPTSELPTKVSDTVVTDGDLKPAAKVQAASLSSVYIKIPFLGEIADLSHFLLILKLGF